MFLAVWYKVKLMYNCSMLQWCMRGRHRNDIDSAGGRGSAQLQERPTRKAKPLHLEKGTRQSSAPIVSQNGHRCLTTSCIRRLVIRALPMFFNQTRITWDGHLLIAPKTPSQSITESSAEDNPNAPWSLRKQNALYSNEGLAWSKAWYASLCSIIDGVILLWF